MVPATSRGTSWGEAAVAEERRSLSAIIAEIVTRRAVSRATAESPL